MTRLISDKEKNFNASLGTSFTMVDVDIMGLGTVGADNLEADAATVPTNDDGDVGDVWISLGGPLTVNLTPGAGAVWRGCEARVGHARGTHAVVHLEPFMAKAIELVGRFALVLHLAQWADDGADGDVGDVSQSTMENAVRLLDEYCVGAWGRAIALVTSTAEANGAVMVDERLKERAWTTVTPRQIAKSGWRGLKSSKECAAVLKELVEYGRVLPPPTQREAMSDRGGRPPVTYRVNPKLLAEWWAP